MVESFVVLFCRAAIFPLEFLGWRGITIVLLVFVKGNRCRKIWCKKSAEKSFSEHILALSIIDHRYRYIDHVWSRSHMYQSHSFCLVNVHSFSQWYTMDCPLWKFLKSFSDIWNFIGNERWMYYMYFYTYLSSFLSFLYLYVCLSRKGFIRLDTFLNGLLNIWKLI